MLTRSCQRARGDFGDVQVGLRGIQVRSSLQQLLVDFGSFDLREQLAFLDMRANVEIPALEITTGSRIDRRVAECLRITGQDNFLRGGAFSRKDHGDGGNRGFLRSLRQPRFGRRARMDTGVNHESENGERGRRDKDCGSAPGSGAGAKSIRTRLHALQLRSFLVLELVVTFSSLDVIRSPLTHA